MKNEVLFPRIGQVRIEDVQTVLGDQFHLVDHFDLAAPSSSGAPSAAWLMFLPVRKGRGFHRVFACPACLSPARVLHTDGVGGFACRWCAKKRTRRQRERARLDWSLGGLQEDQLIREAARPGPVTAGRLAKMTLLSATIQRVSAGLTGDVVQKIADGIVATDALIAEAEAERAATY